MIKSLAVNLITHNGLDSFVIAAIKAVESFASEILVADDASTDSTGSALKEIFPQLKLFVMYEQHFFTRADALNTLKKESKSDWILRIDDDEIFPVETMQEIMDVNGDVPVYTIPFLHYQADSKCFVDPGCHRRDTFYVARLFKNIPEIKWGKKEEVIIYKNTPVSSRGNQTHLCGKLTQPFLHFGELRKNPHQYTFHDKGHCGISLEKYAKYLPTN